MKYGLSEKQLKEIKDILSSYDAVEKAVLFGSRAIDTYKEASDIDIAIKGEKADWSLAIELKEHLEEETYLPFFFDVVAYGSIQSEELREHIDGKGIVLFERGMSEWREYKLGDAITLQRGHDLPKSKMISGEIPVAGSNGIIGCHNISTTRGVGVTIGRSGNIGNAYLYKNDFWAHNTTLYVKDFKGNNEIFIYYFLRNIDFKSFNVGSAVPTLNRNHIHPLDISLPPLPEQKAIAEVLSSLDDKIDLLHRQNKTLEQMAETLFRQWFVEEAGEDWGEGTLGDVIDFNPIYRIPKGGSAPYLEMKNVSTSTFNPEHWYYRDLTSGMKFQNGDSIIARITPCLENGKTSFIAFLEDGQIGWGSTEYIVMRMKEPFHKFISYLIAKDNDFRDFAISSMSGSSGRQRAQATTIQEYEFKIPTDEVIKKLNEQLDLIVKKLLYNARQIPTIESLCDTLLPKLMSGEVRVLADKKNKL